MAFKVFAIILLEPNNEVVERIDRHYEAFHYSETFHLIKCPRTVLSQEVAQVVGLKGDDQIDDVSGFVIQQKSAYAGFTRRDLWEWLASLDDDWGGDE